MLNPRVKFNPLMYNVAKWSGILQKSYFKVCLTILGHYALKGLRLLAVLFDLENEIIKIMFRNKHQRCSVEKVFLKIWQNSQENTFARVFFLIKLQAYLQTTASECSHDFRSLPLLLQMLWFNNYFCLMFIS